MRSILNSEIKNERCNAAALGAFNASVSDTSKYDKVANSKEFKPFADIIKSTSTFEDAYKKVNKIKGVSSQTADKFFNTFANSQRVISPKEAFRKFYDTIKKQIQY